MSRTARCLLRAPLWLTLLVACAQPGTDMIALEGATLIDGTGRAPVRDALILIRHGRIEAVARVREIPVPRGARVIDLVGKTVIPGLIDAHAHVEAWAAQRYVAWGVTAVRDFHQADSAAWTLREEFNLGSVLGPRVYSAGTMIDGAPATDPAATGVATPQEGRRAVDQRSIPGADFIAAATRITPDLLAALVDEARTLHMVVAAHLGKTDALTAARAGVASIEQGSGIVQAVSADRDAVLRAHDRFFAGWTAEEQAWARLDSATVTRVARQLAATQVALVPTLVRHETISRLDDPGLLARPEMDDLPSGAASVRGVAALLRRSGWQSRDFEAFRRSRTRQDQFVRDFKRAGGIVAAGSDAANPLLVPGAALHGEMALLVRAGFTPVEAITAATRRGAHLLGADSLGTLTHGKVADLVVLNSNPATRITATRDIAWVMLRGRIVRPDSLRAAWSGP